MYQLHEYKSTTDLDNALAIEISKQLKTAINKQGKATLAVSGGRTPIALFKLLSQTKLDWSNVYITLVDDRWVDEHHEASNERLVKTHLLTNEAQSAHFISLKTEEDTPSKGLAEVQARLQQNLPLPIDVLILGMGDDGHTASLFPHAKNLASGLDMNSGKLVIDMQPLTAPHERITLTLPVILASRHLYLHLVGDQKKDVLYQATQGQDTNEMPIRAVLQQDKIPLQIYWAK
ncbi:MAG: 6-phosphogluconolactonase [Candidatus Schmidhempelia sp.]|nr:6-phosphogluconolactonase [Candidatus Schmidhempelia sp.]